MRIADEELSQNIVYFVASPVNLGNVSFRSLMEGRGKLKGRGCRERKDLLIKKHDAEEGKALKR